MMTRRTALSGALALTLSAGLAQAQYTLVWSDEFDGTSLDLTKWEPMIGDGCSYGVCNWGNNEWQYYTDRPENVSVSGGLLTITARRENFGGKSYTSARLRTRGLADFLYGRIEARMIIPDADGVWPAFWMLPTNSPYGGWAASGEIDIMESTNAADRVYGTLHYGDGWPNNTSSGGSTTMGGTDFGAGFHTYALEWESNIMRWYVDGTLFSTKTSSTWYSVAAPSNPLAPFDVPFHLLLNVAVGGDWPGSPTASDYPVSMVVDYVRVYQIDPEEQGPYLGTPAPIPGLIEAENFDTGIQGEAYSDSDPENQGGEYRVTGVDIEACAEGGYNIGWMDADEWLEYTVDVQQTGTYRLDTRIASQVTGGQYSYEIDGTPITPLLYTAATGGWQTWTTGSTEVELTEGEHVLRFVNEFPDGGEYNLNYFEFTLLVDCVADIDGNGTLNLDDLDAFITAFLGGDLLADMDGNGTLNLDDLDAFVSAYLAGCA